MVFLCCIENSISIVMKNGHVKTSHVFERSLFCSSRLCVYLSKNTIKTKILCDIIPILNSFIMWCFFYVIYFVFVIQSWTFILSLQCHMTLTVICCFRMKQFWLRTVALLLYIWTVKKHPKNTFLIHQIHIKWVKSVSKDIYKVTLDLFIYCFSK